MFSKYSIWYGWDLSLGGYWAWSNTVSVKSQTNHVTGSRASHCSFHKHGVRMVALVKCIWRSSLPKANHILISLTMTLNGVVLVIYNI